ncbi:MAG TPA: phosphatase PAP2 family protein [Chloroflexota bacterium]|nr:phosphatase PAP2 family protein [Chloroflexota bacterium]
MGSGSHYRMFLTSALVLLALAMLLMVLVKSHLAPLPGDVGVELAVQHALRPTFLAAPVEAVSTAGWPIPSAISVAVMVLCFLALRRWLDALIIVPIAVIASMSNLLTADLVKRPRPQGHDIWVMEKVTHYFSFPSGHVVFATSVWGFIVFLTWRALPGTAWIWLPRILGLVIVITMPVSRILEGEHWPTDVIEGALYGAVWLLVAMSVYDWAASRYPRLLGVAEQGRLGSTPTPQPAGRWPGRSSTGAPALAGRGIKETPPGVNRA